MDEELREGFEVQLVVGDLAVTKRDVELLSAIDDHGSIHAAAAALGRSYAHAQRRIVALEEALGPLTERTRGGSGGGGSSLTDTARALSRRFGRLEAASSGLATVGKTVLEGRVVDRTGELGVVETGVGRLRALVPPESESVEVSIRADAVTLTAPSESPDEDGTSARNRFSGTVRSIDAGETVATVTVDVGGETPLSALVTRSSLDRLDLAPGTEVEVSFKATATRATARPLDGV
ncbi:TOBE domain-containing protein [Natronorarus salvus]|uniref:TOBE domain-containing protein n=1 Tax=Natronorarus salvus TaxID=3117733 RepID=UPI002F262378